MIERTFPLKIVAQMTGYTQTMLREKCRRREITYRRSGRLYLIPASEVVNIQGTLVPAAPLLGRIERQQIDQTQVNAWNEML